MKNTRQAHPATAVSTVEHQLWQATSDSSALLAQLQAAGVPARRVLLISSEPLDPAALPPGSRYRLLAGAPRPQYWRAAWTPAAVLGGRSVYNDHNVPEWVHLCESYGRKSSLLHLESGTDTDYLQAHCEHATCIRN